MVERERSKRNIDREDDGWLRHKLKWLDALAQDQPTRGLAHDIGILLVRRYLFEDPGYAWISMDELAFELDVARSSVLRAFDKLIDGGFLDCERRGAGSGRRNSNHYYIPDRIPLPRKRSAHAPFNAENVAPTHKKRSVDAPENVAPTHKKRSVDATRVSEESEKESERESGKRALRRDSPSPPDFSSKVKKTLRGKSQQSPHGAKPPRRSQQSHRRSEAMAFPDDWILGNDEIAEAHRIAGWDIAKTEAEFAMFKAKMLDKGGHSSNWPAAWETWCRRGLEYQEKQDTKQPLTRFQNDLIGISNWLEGQKQTKH